MTKIRLKGWSASQVNQFQGCQTRWAYNRILRMSEPESQYAASGTAIHSEMELWNNARVPPTSKEGVGFLKYAPEPMTAWSEVPVEFDYQDVHWVGFIDLFYEQDGAWVIHDWKTVGGYTYAKTEETLKTDPAANVYAYAAFLAGADRVRCRWVYMPRGTSKGREVWADMDYGASEAIVSDLSRVASQGNQLRLDISRGELTIDDLEKNTEHCFSFGQVCPRKGVDCFPAKRRVVMATKDELAQFESDIDASFPDSDGWGAPPPLLKSDEYIPATTHAPTPIGVPERGFVNPPGPSVAQPTPEDEFIAQGGDDVNDEPALVVDDGLDALDLADLRAIALAENAPHMPKARKPGVIGAIRAARMVAKAEAVLVPEAEEQVTSFEETPALSLPNTDSNGFSLTKDSKFDTKTGAPLERPEYTDDGVTESSLRTALTLVALLAGYEIQQLTLAKRT